MADIKLETRNLRKIFPGTVALDDCSTKFDSGKVHAIIGKNGSGKSTFVKIISGAINPTAGKIFLNDKEISDYSPNDALNNGIAMVYQELSLVPGLTVAENILIGRMPKNKFSYIDWKTTHAKAKQILNSLEVSISTKTIVSELSVWQQQVIEIAKALSYKPSVLILDEPTSTLAHHETESLFKAIRKLKANNVIILYITHRIQELRQIADTVTVLRDGKLIGTVEMAKVVNNTIVEMMFGKVELQARTLAPCNTKKIVMEIKNLTRQKYFKNISFKLFEGEILGIAGLLGSGRTELLRSIYGADAFDSGEIFIAGKKVSKHTPIGSISNGLALTPENRKEEGLIQILSIKNNLCLASMERISKHGVIQKKEENIAVQRQITDLQIKTGNVQNPVSSLSGGNQQKVVIGNWLNTTPKIIFLDEPTRGIDINAKQGIFDIVWGQSKNGISCIFVSSEIEELVEICHRIIVLRHGTLVADIENSGLELDKLFLMCMGEL